MAPSEEPRREKPRDLFPEWTSRTHAVKDRSAAPPAEPRRSAIGARLPRMSPTGGLTPESKRTLVTLAIAVVAVAIGVVALMRPKRISPERGYEVTPPRDMSSPDVQLEQAARARLRKSPDFSRLGIKVQVRDEVVVVTGRVPDAATREKLLDYLRMTPGVKGVVDQTALEQGEPRRDPQTPAEMAPPAPNEAGPSGPGPGPRSILGR